MNDLWTAVDNYIAERLIPPDEALEAALTANAEAGLPAIDVAPNQGKLLQVLARMVGARCILEIGTLGGYSTIWLARALDGRGKVVTLEINSAYAKAALANFERAGVAKLIDLRLGRAIDTLPGLMGEAPFDFVFIDADKPNNAIYLDWALKLSRPGAVIVVDNVVRGGAVVDPKNNDPNVKGVRDLFDRIAAEPRLIATGLQTVGCKGWDGLAIALVV
jgi:predicted O-methyltransferase YrrM